VPPDFGLMEERANAAIFRALSNATAILPGQVEPEPVVFDPARGEEDDMGVQTVRPALQLRPARATGLQEGLTLQITTQAQPAWDGEYRVRSITPRAEGGLALVMLARINVGAGV